MGVQDFLDDPKSYCGTHAAYVHTNGAVVNNALQAAAGPAIGNNFQSRQYTPVAGQYMTLGLRQGMVQTPSTFLGSVGRHLHISAKLRRDFQVAQAGADVGFRYLPDQEGWCTYMSIDGAATFALTGPLTGCTVAVVRDTAGTLWFFHSFRPNGTAPGAVQANQQSAVMQIKGALNINRPTHWCRFGMEYNGMGFVFGRRRGGGVWKFYSHATNLLPGGGMATTTQKFAEL